MLLLSLCLLCLLLSAAAPAQQPWMPDEFPIGYWYGPSRQFNTLETWRTVKDGNFTFGGMSGYTTEQNRQMLQLCEQVGLKAIVIDSRINWQMVDGEGWEELIAQVVADYADSPALYGYYIQDEPGYRLFKPLGEVSRALEKADPAHLPYINLFPTYASVDQLGTPTYADHLEQYLSIVTPRVLSYDHYALMKDGSLRRDYFENLELIREAALRHGVPAWNIILSLPHLGYRDPTAAEMRWQVYTSLAYGIKGLMYFTYWTHPNWEAAGEVAIVDSAGRPGRLYPIVQRLNAEMQALGRTLLGLTSTGVFHTGDVPQGARRLGRDAILRVPQEVPLLVGFLQDAEGGQYAMVVNRDFADPTEFDATFAPHVVGVEALSPEDGSLQPLEIAEGKLALALEPGGGILLRLTTEFDYPEPPAILEAIDFGFNTEGDAEGWEAGNSMTSPVVQDGVLTLTFTGPDPFLTRTSLKIAPDTYTKIRVRMKLPPCNTEGQLFWTTGDDPGFSDTKYLNFPVIPDGEWHEYEVPVGTHDKWAGKEIRGIRLDPTTGGAEKGQKVEIDRIVGE